LGPYLIEVNLNIEIELPLLRVRPKQQIPRRTDIYPRATTEFNTENAVVNDRFIGATSCDMPSLGVSFHRSPWWSVDTRERLNRSQEVERPAIWLTISGRANFAPPLFRQKWKVHAGTGYYGMFGVTDRLMRTSVKIEQLQPCPPTTTPARQIKALCPPSPANSIPAYHAHRIGPQCPPTPRRFRTSRFGITIFGFHGG
jgi:hypothetical protein